VGVACSSWAKELRQIVPLGPIEPGEGLSGGKSDEKSKVPRIFHYKVVPSACYILEHSMETFMRLLSTTALLSCCLMCVAPVQAQDPPSGGNGAPSATDRSAASQDAAADSSPRDGGARDLARQWIEKQGYTLGLDQSSGTVVVIGSAGFDPEGGAVARRDAFARASSDAKEQIASALASEIMSFVSRKDVAGDIPVSTSLIPAEELRKFAAAVKQLELSDRAFSVSQQESLAKTFARAQVCGLTASNTFFGRAPNKSGSFAVVMRASKTSLALARAAVSPDAPAPTSEVPMSADAWLSKTETTDDELYNCLGVRIFRESAKSNSLCILAFGQADIRGGGDQALQTARQMARSSAEQTLRQFVGEYVLGERILRDSSRVEELKTQETSFEYSTQFLQEMEAIANRLGFSGALPVRDWEGQVTGQAGSAGTAGVVIKWSVTNSDFANQTRRDMEAVGGAAGGRGRLDAKPRDPAVPSDQSKPALPGRKPINPGNQGPTTPEP
jgi:hypothetical protein